MLEFFSKLFINGIINKNYKSFLLKKYTIRQNDV